MCKFEVVPDYLNITLPLYLSCHRKSQERYRYCFSGNTNNVFNVKSVSPIPYNLGSHFDHNVYISADHDLIIMVY